MSSAAVPSASAGTCRLQCMSPVFLANTWVWRSNLAGRPMGTPGKYVNEESSKVARLVHPFGRDAPVDEAPRNQTAHAEAVVV
jgi:hypothetical protein